MTKKTRYFLAGAAAILVAGIGVGLFAYYGLGRQAIFQPGLPDELRYVPQNAALVAYANVQAVMNSDLRRELDRAAGDGPRNRGEIHDVAGIDIETQVNHVVAYLEKGGGPWRQAPRGLMLASGTFEQSKIEQYIRDHGGTIEDYHGKHIALHHEESMSMDGRPDRRGPDRDSDMAVGFLQPNVVALGHVDLVRAVIDRNAASSSANVTSNEELMRIIRDASGETAWVVGHFDEVTSHMGLPPQVRQQVPPLRLVSAKAHIDGGVKATIRAETEDDVSADQMRDVVRGFVSLARMQGGGKPELQDTLKSIELAGSGKVVQVSFSMTPETFRQIVPSRGRRPEPPPFAPPAPPR